MVFKKIAKAVAEKGKGVVKPVAGAAVSKGLMGKAVSKALSGGKDAAPKGMIGKLAAKALSGAKSNPVKSVPPVAAKTPGMKKGGSVDRMGRAVKRKTADVSGRAMKGK